MTPFHHTEKHLSQLPALQLLINLGYNYLSPGKALAEERHSKTSNVLLEHTLYKQLSKLNKIHYKGNDYHFSEANIQEAIQKLKSVQYDGLLRTNEKVYDLITLGTAPTQTLEGDTKSFTLNYIDWKNPANNVFHVVPEYAVKRSHPVETARPDIVLFVNGIPLCVIECKAPAKVIHEKMEEDPAFYTKFSHLIQQVIDDSRAHRISESDYLSEIMGIRDQVISKRRDDVPATIRDNKEACAYYGRTRQLFEGFHIPIDDTALCDLSLTIQKALDDEDKVEFWNDEQAVNRVKGRIDNFFFEELRNKHNIQLNEKQMDAIIDEVMQIARSRRSSRC